MKRTLERGSSTASLFSGGGVGEVLCVCMRERERERMGVKRSPEREGSTASLFWDCMC